MHRSSTAYKKKTVQNSSKQICWCFDVRRQKGMDFFCWKKQYYGLVFWPEAMV